MNSQTQTPDFSDLVQGLLASKAKTDSLVKESKTLVNKMGRTRRSLEKLTEAMSEENTAKSAAKSASKRRKKN